MQVVIDEQRRRLVIAPGPGIGVRSILLNLPMRKWMQVGGKFVVPWTRQNATHLLKYRKALELEDSLISFLEEMTQPPKASHEFPSWYSYKTKPMPQQLTAVKHGYKMRTAALYMDMGTGKTKSAIDIVTAAFYERQIDAVVVVCPMSVVAVWKMQMAEHCPCQHEVIFVTSATKIEKITPDISTLRMLVVGVESLSQGKAFQVIMNFINRAKAAVVVDESSDIKNHAAIRTKAVIEMGKTSPLKLVMSGTPVTRNLIDLYSQFEFLDPNIIGIGDWYAFRNRYCRMGGYKNKEIVGYDNLDELLGLINPYIYRCTKEEVMPYLPPKVYTSRFVKMSAAQQEAYAKVKKGKMPKVDVKNCLTKVLRLQQIVGGYLGIGKKEDEHTLEDTRELVCLVEPEDNPKILEILSVMEQTTGSIIIWARYLHEVNAIAGVLEARGEKVLKMVGGLSPEEREQIQRDFQSKKARVFIGTQQAGGIGLTLTAATTVVFYSNTDSYKERIQAEDRAHRKGQDNKVLYVDLIMEKSVDLAINASIHDKKDLATYISERIKDGDTENAILEIDNV